jgi:hypothetical protein
MSLRCLFGHDWIEGKVPTVTPFTKKPNPLSNRICFRCGKREMRAKEAADERAARNKIRQELDA